MNMRNSNFFFIQKKYIEYYTSYFRVKMGLILWCEIFIAKEKVTKLFVYTWMKFENNCLTDCYSTAPWVSKSLNYTQVKKYDLDSTFSTTILILSAIKNINYMLLMFYKSIFCTTLTISLFTDYRENFQNV